MQAAQSPANEAQHYAGPEKREYSRIPAGYPICVRFASLSGETVERFAQTMNVSVEGVLFSCAESLEIGTRVDFQIGIPSAHAASLPAAQLNGKAVVMRSERVDPLAEEEGYGAKIALKFIHKPSFSTEVSMFD